MIPQFDLKDEIDNKRIKIKNQTLQLEYEKVTQYLEEQIVTKYLNFIIFFLLILIISSLANDSKPLTSIIIGGFLTIFAVLRFIFVENFNLTRSALIIFAYGLGIAVNSTPKFKIVENQDNNQINSMCLLSILNVLTVMNSFSGIFNQICFLLFSGYISIMNFNIEYKLIVFAQLVFLLWVDRNKQFNLVYYFLQNQTSALWAKTIESMNEDETAILQFDPKFEIFNTLYLNNKFQERYKLMEDSDIKNILLNMAVVQIGFDSDNEPGKPPSLDVNNQSRHFILRKNRNFIDSQSPIYCQMDMRHKKEKFLNSLKFREEKKRKLKKELIEQKLGNKLYRFLRDDAIINSNNQVESIETDFKFHEEFLVEQSGQKNILIVTFKTIKIIETYLIVRIRSLDETDERLKLKLDYYKNISNKILAYCSDSSIQLYSQWKENVQNLISNQERISLSSIKNSTNSDIPSQLEFNDYEDHPIHLQEEQSQFDIKEQETNIHSRLIQSSQQNNTFLPSLFQKQYERPKLSTSLFYKDERKFSPIESFRDMKLKFFSNLNSLQNYQIVLDGFANQKLPIINPEKILLENFLQQYQNLFEGWCQQRDISFEIQNLISKENQINTDLNKLRQIFLNIIRIQTTSSRNFGIIRLVVQSYNLFQICDIPGKTVVTGEKFLDTISKKVIRFSFIFDINYDIESKNGKFQLRPLLKSEFYVNNKIIAQEMIECSIIDVLIRFLGPSSCSRHFKQFNSEDRIFNLISFDIFEDIRVLKQGLQGFDMEEDEGLLPKFETDHLSKVLEYPKFKSEFQSQSGNLFN